MAVANTTPIPVDTPEARRYNRIRRWLSMADLVLGFAFLVVLLVTGWSGALRDYAVQLAPEQYSIQVFFYVLMLLLQVFDEGCMGM